jgi:hypothetical protein
MKRATVFIGLLLVLIFAVFPACTSSRSDQQLARIEAQLQALTANLASTQLELATTKKSLIEAQDKAGLLQQQLQTAQQVQQTQASSTTYAPAVQTVTVIPDQYYNQYTPYNNYSGGYYPPTPPPPSPPLPLPHPPAPPVPSTTSPFYYQGSLIWPDGRVTVYTPPPQGYIYDNNGSLVPLGVNSLPVIPRPRHNPVTGTRYQWGD